MSDESTPQPPDPLAGRPEFLDDAGPGYDELPPVEPPSAGFIVQLFVVPAIIVAMIVGVYLLFGRLASGEQDWRKQLSNVRSDNPHIRGRGEHGLAQMLLADSTSDGQRLAENRDVARELANLLNESTAKTSASEEDLKQQEFLARTLGLIDVDDLTLPALSSALQPDQDANVRKNALASLAAIANRRKEAGELFDDRLVVEGRDRRDERVGGGVETRRHVHFGPIRVRDCRQALGSLAGAFRSHDTTECGDRSGPPGFAGGVGRVSNRAR